MNNPMPISIPDAISTNSAARSGSKVFILRVRSIDGYRLLLDAGLAYPALHFAEVPVLAVGLLPIGLARRAESTFDVRVRV